MHLLNPSAFPVCSAKTVLVDFIFTHFSSLSLQIRQCFLCKYSFHRFFPRHYSPYWEVPSFWLLMWGQSNSGNEITSTYFFIDVFFHIYSLIAPLAAPRELITQTLDWLLKLTKPKLDLMIITWTQSSTNILLVLYRIHFTAILCLAAGVMWARAIASYLQATISTA